MISEIAPAKINLYLHVGGIRPDGLHDLASLFVFANKGDVVSATPSALLSLKIIGPFSDALEPFPVEDNLVLKAAELLQEHAGTSAGAELTLEKNLPVASGIGGGSADAAAALRALMKLWSVKVSDTALHEIAFKLGADVPACLAHQPIYVSGAGEVISTGPTLPPMWVCLVNPLVPTPTGPIFKIFDEANPSPAVPTHMPEGNGGSVTQFCEALRGTRNDLEVPAITTVPVVGEVKEFLKEQSGCHLARMSGSGATCFGVFDNLSDAEDAAHKARAQKWWACAANIVH